MTTLVRPKISKRNKYYISKHRYYELKHFCLQYREWKEELSRLYLTPKALKPDRIRLDILADPTPEMAEKRMTLFNKMELVEQTSIAADAELSHFIFLAVTEGATYESLQMRHNIPCSRGTFYDRYRRFFWLLSEQR